MNDGTGHTRMRMHILLILNFVALADEAFFVPFTHVRINFVIAKEAFSTKLAERMNTALDLLLLAVITPVAPLHRGYMQGKDIWVVEGVFMGENLLYAYTQIADGGRYTHIPMAAECSTTHHMSLPWVARVCSLRSLHPLPMKLHWGSGQLKRRRMSVSSIISWVSKDIASLASLYGTRSGV